MDVGFKEFKDRVARLGKLRKHPFTGMHSASGFAAEELRDAEF